MFQTRGVPDLDLSFLFCSFWDFPDFSGIFLICSGTVRGFPRFVLFLFLGLFRAPTRNSPERVRDTIWTFPEKSGKHPGLETPRFSFSQFLVRISSGGVGVFHVKGWGPKGSVRPSKPRESKLFGGIFAGISRGCPKKVRKKGFVFSSRP